ncbi:MAG: hypothetical protein U9Q69_04590 [Nanoarchaeota archaeon]|nr:hypothetical protein [Nanoarchaeota archaeon]
MSFENELKNGLQNEKLYESNFGNKKVCIVGEILADNVIKVERINITHNYNGNLTYLIAEMVDKLNNNSNQAGNDWMIIESEPYFGYAFSAAFDKKEGNYFGYGLFVDKQEIKFKKFYFERKEEPRREEVATITSINGLENLIKILAG